MKEMKLINGKQLHVVNHGDSKQNQIDINCHTRQTNPGYSRNKLGGFYTSWMFFYEEEGLILE